MERFKKAVLDSYIAAIALGWIFAQAIVHFAYVFAVPVAQWLMRGECCDSTDHASALTSFHFRDAAPDLIKCVSLLVVGYLLLRWLYFKRSTKAPAATDTR